MRNICFIYVMYMNVSAFLKIFNYFYKPSHRAQYLINN